MIINFEFWTKKNHKFLPLKYVREVSLLSRKLTSQQLQFSKLLFSYNSQFSCQLANSFWQLDHFSPGMWRQCCVLSCVLSLFFVSFIILYCWVCFFFILSLFFLCYHFWSYSFVNCYLATADKVSFLVSWLTVFGSQTAFHQVCGGHVVCCHVSSLCSLCLL